MDGGMNQILVVEDDPDGRLVVGHFLSHMAWQSCLFATAEAATRRLFDTPADFSAILLDLALPGMDGWEMLALVRQNPATQKLPCIALTGYHTSLLKERAINAGFAGYLAKPIDLNTFSQELNRVLPGRKMYRLEVN